MTATEEALLLRHRISILEEALRRNQAELAGLKLIAKRKPGTHLDLAVEVANLRREFYTLRRFLMNDGLSIDALDP